MLGTLPHLKLHCSAEINRSSPECRPLPAPPSFFITGVSWNLYLASFSLFLIISWVQAGISTWPHFHVVLHALGFLVPGSFWLFFTWPLFAFEIHIFSSSFCLFFMPIDFILSGIHFHGAVPYCSCVTSL